MLPLDPKIRLSRLTAALMLCLYALPTPAQDILPQAAPVAYEQAWLTVYPQVTVNGSVRDGTAPFMSRNGVLYARAESLRAYGVVLPSETAAKAGKGGITPEIQDGASAPGAGVWFDLASVPGLQAKYDAATQILDITAPLEWQPDLKTTRIGEQKENRYPIGRPGFAAVLNYDTNFSRNNSGGSTQGVFGELRLTTPWGYLNHTQFANRSHARDGENHRSDARLDTYWRTVWPERGLSLTVGDTLTGQLGSWGGTRIGGIKLSRTYNTQPWKQTAPLRSYLGRSTLPGTVDLYLDGVKQMSRDIAAGEYELVLPPTISGRSNAQVVATDVLGRTVVVDMPLYGGSGLLAKGLNEWSLEAGYVRRDYGVRSAKYQSDPAASGTLRYGLTNFLTAQIHGEAAHGYRQIGISADTLLGSLGQLNLTHAQSRFAGQTGQRSSAFFSTQWRQTSFSAGWNKSDGRFAELGDTAYDDRRPTDDRHGSTSASVSAGWSSDKLGSFSLSYLHSRTEGRPADNIGSFSWSRNLKKRASLYTSAAKNFNGKHELSLYAGLSVNLDKGYSASAGAGRNGRDNSYQMTLNKTGSGLNSTNWGLSWQQTEDTTGRRKNTLNANIRYHSVYGDGWANTYSHADSNNWNAGWRGGIVLMGGGLFATRQVNDSFAVVSTGGMADVPIRAGGMPVGKTNRRGLALIPNLSAYQKNTVSVDITELPLDVQLEHTVAEIAPSERSGMRVEFKIHRTRAATMTLKDGQNQWLPGGGTIADAQGDPVAVTGFDGKTYIENMKEGKNNFTVTLPENGGNCSFEADYPEERNPDTLPDLGDIICK